MIKIKVREQTMLMPSYQTKFVAGTKNFVKFQFLLDESWDGMVVFAQFQQENRSESIYLDENNTVTLPVWVEAGTCDMYLAGTDITGDVKKGCTNGISIKIGKNGIVEDTTSTVITETLYEQLVNKVHMISEELNDFFLVPSIQTQVATTVENKMDDFLENGYLANLTIEDNSITKNKLSFNSSYTEVVASLPENPDTDTDYILKTDNGLLYYKYVNNEWQMVSGSSAIIASKLPETGVEYADYYILNISDGKYYHYRWVNGAFHEIGTLTYTPEQLDTMLFNLQNDINNSSINPLSDRVTANELNIDILETDIERISTIGSMYIDDENYLHIYNLENEDICDPVSLPAGGGSGSVTNGAVLTVTNTNGWLSTTIAEGNSCSINFNWSSIEEETPTGDGTLRVTVNGIVKAIVNVRQGSVSFEVSSYLSAGSNVVKMTVSDIYGNTRTYTYTITLIRLSISSSFDSTTPHTGYFNFPYVPEGQTSKLIHFVLDDVEIDTITTTVSGRQLNYLIPAQSHGAHTLKVYFTTEINGHTVQSNVLYYEFISIETNNLEPIITSDFNQEEVSQYSSLQIGYQVYDPSNLTSTIQLSVNGAVTHTITVDRSKQIWSYRADQSGEVSLAITCGDTVKTLNFIVNEVEIDAKAETENLALALSAYGRSNGEANPAVWKSGTISCIFDDFNWTSDGWQLDDDGSTVLRVMGDARLTIPYQPFSSDFRTTGKTIEIEFATKDVRDYDATIISCMSGGRGFKFTAQEAFLKSEQSSISMQYKDDEHMRISFVVEKRAENRLIYCYVDGIISGIAQYPVSDDFSQTTPVNISVGSSDCTVDLYNIRIYDNDLTKNQMLDNWIADTPNGSLMLEKYDHNNVYDEYGQIVISKLPSDLPYMILTGPALPQTKGDKKTISGQFLDPINGSRSFSFEDCQIDVQGTSSAGYARKNYKMKFNGGFVTSGGLIEKYALRSGQIPVKTFTMKADVASSEGCNNVELVRLYNDICPYKTPPQTENEVIRQGIDGFPMVIFWNDGEQTTFLGKYNFNNDKGTEEVYGFSNGDESWETLNNTSDRALFKSWALTDWSNDFEGRYPDGNTDVTNLKNFVETVSAWESPTKEQVESIAEKQSAIFYYLFTEFFLMVDSRGKNAFPTKFLPGKWCWFPYDFDTAIGINNEGQLVFGYSLETGDKLTGNADVFNAEGHKFWKAIKNLYQDEIGAMYESLRNSNALSYDTVESMFENHQSKWPEAIFNEDSQYKYLDPLIQDNNGSYLTMLQGSKKSQRQWWLKHRFQYMDSKYNVADNKAKKITLRGYAIADLVVTPYADMYVNIKYGSYMVSTRGTRNVAYTMTCPLEDINDTETYIYGCDCIKKIEGMAAYQVGYADFADAEKLIEIVLGSNEEGYENEHLKVLHLGNLNLLQKIDCRNCTELGTGESAAVDASGCSNIEEIYMDNTKITGVNLPNGGQLRVLHLPATVTNLTIRNQRKLEDVIVADYSNISTLWIENCNLLNPIELLEEIAPNARIRLIGFDLGTLTVSELESFMDSLDTFRGMDENGNNMETAQVSGTCHIENITGAQMSAFKSRYPYIDITFDHVTCYMYYMSEDGNTLLYTETVVDGADAAYTGTASKTSTAQYAYTFDGWSRTAGGTLWADAKKAVTSDRTVYAHFTANLRYYTVYFYNGSTLLQTVNNVPYGGSASYSGSTSSITNSSGDPFTGWNPLPTNIQGNTSCYAQFVPMYTCTFKNGDETLYTVRVQQGSTVTYAGPDMTNVSDSNGNPWIGWDKSLSNIQANTTFNAVFYDFGETITDSWQTIVNRINSASNGASCGYSVGAIKVVDFGGDLGKVGMQLIAVDTDNLASGGKAKTTWLAKEIGRTSHRMNPARASTTDEDGNTVYTMGTGTIGGWEHSEMRTFVKDHKANLPSALQSGIKDVTKTTTAYNTAGSSYTESVTDDLWIPDYNELFSSSAEVNYTSFFPDSTSRIKYKVGASSSANWWGRYAYGTYYFKCVHTTGGDNSNSNASSTLGVVPGFCI